MMNNVHIHSLSVTAPQPPVPSPTFQPDWKMITFIAFVVSLVAGIGYVGYRQNLNGDNYLSQFSIQNTSLERLVFNDTTLLFSFHYTLVAQTIYHDGVYNSMVVDLSLGGVNKVVPLVRQQPLSEAPITSSYKKKLWYISNEGEVVLADHAGLETLATQGNLVLYINIKLLGIKDSRETVCPIDVISISAGNYTTKSRPCSQ